jgi:N-formylglutamate amidohydrolase
MRHTIAHAYYFFAFIKTDKPMDAMFESIILHIPHSSSNFDFAGQDRFESLWRRQAEPLIDWYTDELFTPYITDERIIPLIFDTCRTLVDVERMCYDPLENKGLGITAYTLLQTNGILYKVRESQEEDIRYMKKYLDHQHKLAHLLVDHPNSLLIDCHSFSSKPTILQPDISKNQDVDICIGFNEDDTKPSDVVLALVADHFTDRGYKVSFNVPFSNSKTVETPARYTSLMIEINKSIYMDEDTLEKKGSFEKVREDVISLYESFFS